MRSRAGGLEVCGVDDVGPRCPCIGAGAEEEDSRMEWSTDRMCEVWVVAVVGGCWRVCVDMDATSEESVARRPARTDGAEGRVGFCVGFIIIWCISSSGPKSFEGDRCRSSRLRSVDAWWFATSEVRSNRVLNVL